MLLLYPYWDSIPDCPMLSIAGLSRLLPRSFQSTFLGSRAVAGELGSVLSMRDPQGVSIAEALQQQGLKTGEEAAAAMKLPADKVRAVAARPTILAWKHCEVGR